jgi:hypothetical protein
MGLLLSLLLLLAGALDPLAIPWWVWAGVLFYVAVRQRMENYSPGSLVRAARYVPSTEKWNNEPAPLRILLTLPPN